MLYKTEKVSKEIEIAECFNIERYQHLIEDIKSENIEDDTLKTFLLLAATRFIDINYNNVAQYYYNLEPGEVKELFKKLNLVIVDDNDAIENGYVKLSKSIIDNLHRFIKEK